MQIQGEYKIVGKETITTSKRTFFIATKDIHVEKKNIDRFGVIHCNGICPWFPDGTPVVLNGEFSTETYKDDETDRVFFSVQSIKEYFVDEDSLVSYISSGICKGVGASIASAIKERYGKDFYSLIENEPNFALRMAEEIPRLTLEKANMLIEAILQTKDTREVFEYLSEISDSCSPISTLNDIYGRDGLRLLKQNPYKIGREVGYNFYECDAIAKRENFTSTSKERLEGLVYAAVDSNTTDGNTYMTLTRFLQKASYIDSHSAIGEDEEFFPLLLTHQMLKTKDIVVKELGNSTVIYSEKLYNAEICIAKNLVRLHNAKKELSFDEGLIKEIEEVTGKVFAEGQRNCFNALRTTGLKLVIGKPGAGKTTTTNGLISFIRSRDPYASIVLCASTGNAAHKLSEATHMKAFTVQKMLEMTSEDSIVNPIGYDYIFVDEMSMVGTLLFSKLIGAVKSTATVILVGDVNQLESVDAGDVLHDLMEFDFIEKYVLSRIYRQEENSSIIENAERINKGIVSLKTDTHFEIKRMDNIDDIVKEAQRLYKQFYNQNNISAVQMLSTVKNENYGVTGLNNVLQKTVNEDTVDKLTFRKSLFKLFDKVIFTRNNYDIGYVNGTQGQITNITPTGEITVNTSDGIITVDRDTLCDLHLSYAMTIHKSQGSEYPYVIVILPKEVDVMLKRNLLYTAVTRASEHVTILSEGNALETAILNRNHKKRMTSLKVMVEKEKVNLIRKTEERRAG